MANIIVPVRTIYMEKGLYDQPLRVLDALTNDAVVSAKIEIVAGNLSTGLSITQVFTNAIGEATIYDLPSGIYTIRVSHKDYKEAKIEQLTIA